MQSETVTASETIAIPVPPVRATSEIELFKKVSVLASRMFVANPAHQTLLMIVPFAAALIPIDPAPAPPVCEVTVMFSITVGGPPVPFAFTSPSAVNAAGASKIVEYPPVPKMVTTVVDSSLKRSGIVRSCSRRNVAIPHRPKVLHAHDIAELVQRRALRCACAGGEERDLFRGWFGHGHGLGLCGINGGKNNVG
jgi:hypothetical protein